MKKERTIIGLIALLITFAMGPVRAQEWSFGPKAYLGLSRQLTVGEQVQIGSTLLSTVNYGDAVGASVGAFARYDQPKWYVELDGTRGKYSLTNVSISGPAGGFPTYQSAVRTDARLIAGVKPLPWLRLSVGLTGVQNRWRLTDYTGDIRANQESIQRYPTETERYTRQIEQYQLADALQNSYKKTNLEGQAGIGADIGGLTLDLTYAQSLTPPLHGVSFQNRTYAFRQDYGYWSLGIGYKLFPLKQHLLAPRKNKAYERINQDIPFYKNEFHLGVGLLGEDIGSQLIYENRYTRYFTRRVGLTAGVNFSHSFSGPGDRPSGVPMANQFTLLAGVRVLPLYSHRHTIGLTIGPLLTYADELQAGAGLQVINGQEVRYLNVNRNSAVRELNTGWHSSIDYNFALTDRLIAGSWLRLLGQTLIIPDYANFGIQAGYRF